MYYTYSFYYVRYETHTLNSCRTASPLVKLVEEEERWEAPDNLQGVFPQSWGGTELNLTDAYANRTKPAEAGDPPNKSQMIKQNKPRIFQTMSKVPIQGRHFQKLLTFEAVQAISAGRTEKRNSSTRVLLTNEEEK
ncbi:hypothetical protein TNCV_3356731 [Trichonephila clavipes]|nr:hypothetical protein TNCV_3356731 [Trichonephila clavipes]